MSLCQAVAMLKVVFDKYAGIEGNSKTLTKAELTELLKKEFEMPTANAGMDAFFHNLDADGDGVIDFKEFATLAVAFSVILAD